LIIHLHFHSRATGVTKSIESIIPAINKYSAARVFGYGIVAPMIGFRSFLKYAFGKSDTIIHAHRNNEIIFALIIRMMGGKFRLIATRHAESVPARLTVFLMKKTDGVISLTRSMHDNLPLASTIVRHGVNTDTFNIGERRKIEGIPQKNLITVIGRIRKAKGQLIVIKALAPLLQTNPDWALVIIGRTDNDSYLKEITAIAERDNIAQQVHFVPETSRITGYYHASRAVVIASYSEGFSLVCIEAMACGIITAATGGVGIHDQAITNGENGFLFPAGDHEALRVILASIISDKVDMPPAKIRESILREWSLRSSALNLLAFYGIETKSEAEALSV
jgi:mannosyltransferase